VVETGDQEDLDNNERMNTMLETIGFIGLGVMGKPMAHNLIKADYPLVVYNRHQEVANEFLY
jgi:6-phosphogluconate dehydrogenase